MQKIFFLFCFVGALFGQCQVLQPIDIAKKIFAKEKFADMLYYITDEYKGVPSGQDLNDKVSIGY